MSVITMLATAVGVSMPSEKFNSTTRGFATIVPSAGVDVIILLCANVAVGLISAAAASARLAIREKYLITLSF